jgi:hypothetical protein
MNWTTILSSMGGSAILVAAFAYVLKRAFDTTLKARLDQYNDRNKIQIQEAVRREAFIFDEQYQMLKQTLMLAYKSRNKARDFLNVIDSIEEANDLLAEIEIDFKEMNTLVYSARAVCPESYFLIIHNYKGALNAYCKYAGSLLKLQKNGENVVADKIEQRISDMKNTYLDLDRLYNSLTEEVHAHLGIKGL